jgi:vacuolar-type H+-ATPase subunit F/Vma7
MNKKIISLLMAVFLLFSLTGCGSQETKADEQKEEKPAVEETKKEESYKIGIVTPTLSTSEDEFRAAEMMVEKYPDIVNHITLPENFSTEIETGLSQIISLADDPQMKAITIASGQSGLLPAFQKIKEKRPDIITITAPIWDDPDMMSKYIDVCLDTNWVKRGESIAKKAHKMGAKTLIHYSFPTHMAKEVIVNRKDMMKKTCEELGMKFVEVTTPDPQTGNGPTAMQQFLREDIPRQIEKYGKDTNIFGTNCGMYEVIIDEALKLKYLMAEQCCPTPTQAFPTVMGLELSKEDSGNFDKINKMISEKAAEAGMTGRLSGWPVSVSVFLPQYSVELAKKMIEDKDFDAKNIENLEKLGKEVSGYGVSFDKLKPELDNYFVMIMDSIFY